MMVASMSSSLRLRAACRFRCCCSALFIVRVALATRGTGARPAMDPEYAKLMGATATPGQVGDARPARCRRKALGALKRPVLRQRAERQGRRHPARVSRSRASPSAISSPSPVAIPIGFLIGMSPLMSRALDPFIQVLKPISPLAWMPLALYTIKDFGSRRSS